METGYKLIGFGFLVAILFSLGMYGIFILETGVFLSSFYALLFGLISTGVIIGTIVALIYAAMEDEQVAGWTYFILIIIFGIIGIVLTFALAG
jgi:hypothetical protein